jgi:hypothetical protein
MVLRPKGTFPEGMKVAEIHLAFCAKCLADRQKIKEVVTKAARELDEWLKST